jgi:hypothetical protein
VNRSGEAVVPETHLTLDDLNRATLARQLLLARKRLAVPKAVSQLLAVQAQLARPPFIGLWSRIDGFTREMLSAALHGRTIVRATMMRGTLHLVTTADYVALRACLQPGLEAGLQSILGDRLSGTDMTRVAERAAAFFEAPHSFDDARKHLIAQFPEGDERAMGYAMRLRLPLVQVPTETVWAFPGQAHFVSAHSWIGRSPQPSCDPDVLVERYLAAYGPATVKDAQTWLGVPGVKEAMVRLRPSLRVFRGPKSAELFDLPAAPRPPADTPAPVRFLPDYDSTLIARADERLLAAAHRRAVFLPGLRVLPTFLVNGRVAGTWTIERTKGTATVSLSAFVPLSRVVRSELEEEGEALARFIEPDARSLAVKIEQA